MSRSLPGAFRQRLSLTAELVAFPHTIFALPFAYMGMLLGSGGRPTLHQFIWITLAMVGARTAAMSFNRIADRVLDAANPRTAGRPLPSRRMRAGWAAGLLAVSVALLVLAAWMLNPLCLALSPLALAIVLGYSYTKRFTFLTHFLLGVSLAIAPVGAWIGVDAEASWVPVLLALIVVCWTAGFDIIYSCQDVAFDREYGLKSLPAKYGVATALKMSSALHTLMVILLIVLAPLAQLGPVYLTGVLLAAAVLIYEHRLVRPDDLSRVNTAFFTMNGWISVTLFLAVLLDQIV